MNKMAGVNKKFKYDDTTFIEVGRVFSSRNYGSFEVLSTPHCNKVTIRFLETGAVCVVQSSHIRENNVRDPLFPSVHGKGFIGEGKFSSKNRNMYKTWGHMMERCYSPKYHEKFPTYKECTVHPDWWNFQVFAQWYIDNKPEVTLPEGRWELDKDLSSRGNKEYSEDTCTWLPSVININLVTYTKDTIYPTGVFYDKARPNVLRSSYVETFNGLQKEIYLGSFKDEESAHIAYIKAKQDYVQRLAIHYQDFISESTQKKLSVFKVLCYCKYCKPKC